MNFIAIIGDIIPIYSGETFTPVANAINKLKDRYPKDVVLIHKYPPLDVVRSVGLCAELFTHMYIQFPAQINLYRRFREIQPGNDIGYPGTELDEKLQRLQMRYFIRELNARLFVIGDIGQKIQAEMDEYQNFFPDVHIEHIPL